MAIQYKALAYLFIVSWTLTMISMASGSRLNICPCVSKLLDTPNTSTKKHQGAGHMKIDFVSNDTRNNDYKNTLEVNWTNMKVAVKNALRQGSQIMGLIGMSTLKDLLGQCKSPESLICSDGSSKPMSTRRDNLDLAFRRVLCVYNYVSAINADVEVAVEKKCRGKFRKLHKDFQKNLSSLLCSLEFESHSTKRRVRCNATLDPLPSDFLAEPSIAGNQDRVCRVVYSGHVMLKDLEKKKWFNQDGKNKKGIQVKKTGSKKDRKIKKDRKLSRGRSL